MKKSFNKILFLSLAIMLLFVTGFSSFGQANDRSLEKLGQLHGEFDHTSTNITTVIVELTEPSIVEAKHRGKSQTKGNLENVREDVILAVKNLVPNSKINQEYDYVFSGFSVELPENEIRNLLSVSGIKAVYPNITYQASEFEPKLISAEEFTPAMADSAPFIGAAEAWDLGFTGEGITVAVIDTGVDYTHPDLVHAFGDYKGWDFVDNNDDPQETPANDPRGASTNHGTHVAGTIAANGEIQGVAPNATLLAYRVLGPGGSGSTQNVIAGIERAVEDGADVMNLSLGAAVNDADYATSLVLDWVMAEGVVAVTSNGNSGPDRYTVGSPGSSRDAISVGATQLPYEVYDVKLTTAGNVYDTAKVLGYKSIDGLLALDGEELNYVFAGYGSDAEFAELDVEGKIALISRGDGIAFVDKATSAKEAGAVGAIIFNNAPGEFEFIIPGMDVPTIKLSGEDGQAILDELEAGNNTVALDLEYISTDPEIVAEFSSRGPVLETWMIKPDVSAPGVNIVSTVPTHNPDNSHGYASMQGTSMSSPHVAGAVALLLEKYPNWTPEEVKSALMNTAESITDPDGKVYPFNTQGAGSIRVVDALNTETLVAPGSYSYGTFLKDSGRQTERQHFEVKNLSNNRKQYSMNVEFFDGKDHIKVITSDNLNIKAGGKEKVNMNVQVNSSALDWGYYEGVITLTSGDEVIEVPTILFVGDPYLDDHLVSDHLVEGSFTLSDDGIFDISLLLNRDVDYAEIYFYFADMSGGYYITEFYDLYEGQNNLELDASGILPQLPQGEYALVTFIGDEHWEEGWILGYFDN